MWNGLHSTFENTKSVYQYKASPKVDLLIHVFISTQYRIFYSVLTDIKVNIMSKNGSTTRTLYLLCNMYFTKTTL